MAAKSHPNGAENPNPNPIPYLGAGNTLRSGDTVTGLTGIIDFGRITQATGSAALLDYNVEFKSQDSYAATPYRASDHDWVIVGLQLGKAQPGGSKRPL